MAGTKEGGKRAALTRKKNARATSGKRKGGVTAKAKAKATARKAANG